MIRQISFCMGGILQVSPVSTPGVITEVCLSLESAVTSKIIIIIFFWEKKSLIYPKGCLQNYKFVLPKHYYSLFE